jgi:4-hydroxy-tetrahydrodipicolinate synthase
MSRALRQQQLRTVQVVPATPYTATGEIHYETMQTLNRRLYEAGIRVFIPCAGSAEFDSLSADEIVNSIRAVRQAIGDDAILMAPVGLQIGHALDIGRRSLEAGADAILVMPMSGPYLSNQGVRDYYLTLLDTLGAPTLVYKKGEIPSDALLLELADHPGIVGVKYAVNDVDAFTRIVAADEGRIEWICGSAERFAPFFFLAGASGYTSGAANLCPHLTLAMHAALVAGDYPQAMRLLERLRPIEDYRARAGSSYNINFLKHALRHTGLDFGHPRPPQRKLTSDEMREIDELVPTLLQAEEEFASTPAAAR